MQLKDLLLVFTGEVLVYYILDEVYFGDAREAFDCKDGWFLDNEVMEVISNGEDSLIIYTR